MAAGAWRLARRGMPPVAAALAPAALMLVVGWVTSLLLESAQTGLTEQASLDYSWGAAWSEPG